MSDSMNNVNIVTMLKSCEIEGSLYSEFKSYEKAGTLFSEEHQDRLNYLIKHIHEMPANIVEDVIVTCINYFLKTIYTIASKCSYDFQEMVDIGISEIVSLVKNYDEHKVHCTPVAYINQSLKYSLPKYAVRGTSPFSMSNYDVEEYLKYHKRGESAVTGTSAKRINARTAIPYEDYLEISGNVCSTEQFEDDIVHKLSEEGLLSKCAEILTKKEFDFLMDYVFSERLKRDIAASYGIKYQALNARYRKILDKLAAHIDRDDYNY